MMTSGDAQSESILKEETAMRWGFLDDEAEPCAVVTERMELVYLNGLARVLTPPEWFAKRCFEVLPVTNEQCAWQCPTITAVHEAKELTYCEEHLRRDDGSTIDLGTAVIPFSWSSEDGAKALLMFRLKEDDVEGTEFQEELLRDASDLQARLDSEAAARG